MTQDERWQQHYDEVMLYMEKYKRCPSKHRLEDHRMLNWIKVNRKLRNKGLLAPERLAKFNRLLALAGTYRHVNQYV